MRIVILMTTHNRVEVTLRCLASLHEMRTADGLELAVVLADAGSADGTVGAVSEQYPDVTCLKISADHYWAEGMRYAWEYAQSMPFDYLLWLNDDVTLYPDALQTLFDTERDGGKAIIVGALVDPADGSVTYSGFKRHSSIRPLTLSPIAPNGTAVRCDTLNGNVVLVPKDIDSRLGGFPVGYVHSMADLAFGFEAKRHSIPVTVSVRPVGECRRNSIAGTWEDPSLAVGTRIRKLHSPKGLPPRIWPRFCTRYGGMAGVMAATSPYRRILLSPSSWRKQLAPLIRRSK